MPKKFSQGYYKKRYKSVPSSYFDLEGYLKDTHLHALNKRWINFSELSGYAQNKVSDLKLKPHPAKKAPRVKSFYRFNHDTNSYCAHCFPFPSCGDCGRSSANYKYFRHSFIHHTRKGDLQYNGTVIPYRRFTAAKKLREGRLKAHNEYKRRARLAKAKKKKEHFLKNLTRGIDFSTFHIF